jgi:hypothetical protein
MVVAISSQDPNSKGTFTMPGSPSPVILGFSGTGPRYAFVTWDERIAGLMLGGRWCFPPRLSSASAGHP